MTTKTDPSKLPQWKGHPVPWVTRWSGEINMDKAAISLGRDGLLVRYEEGPENREVSGVLWKREGISRRGEPDFSQVNTYRQRASVAKRLCQVCGDRIPDGLIRWLLVPELLTTLDDGRTITTSPPTCEGCVPLALELCPALKKGHVIAKVLEYRIWGVQGSVVGINHEDRRAFERKARVEYDVDHPFPMTAVLARQQVVEFTKFVIEEQE